MNHSFLPSILGLLSAIIWGAGDFSGGLASRRAPLLSVVILAELTGFLLLVILAFTFGELFPSASAVAFAVAAGLSGSIGLGSLYYGLAIGRAGIVAPISAVVGATLPAVFTILTIGPPGLFKQIGFVVALIAIVLASHAKQDGRGGKALPFAFLAGLGFGGFYIFMDQASEPGSTFYPLAIARGCPVPFLLAINFIRSKTIVSADTALPLIVLTGLLDAAGTVLFLLSSTMGRLDVATILSSLYPASTVILSRLLLNEQISKLQLLGVVLALMAIVLIAW